MSSISYSEPLYILFYFDSCTPHPLTFGVFWKRKRTAPSILEHLGIADVAHRKSLSAAGHRCSATTTITSTHRATAPSHSLDSRSSKKTHQNVFVRIDYHCSLFILGQSPSVVATSFAGFRLDPPPGTRPLKSAGSPFVTQRQTFTPHYQHHPSRPSRNGLTFFIGTHTQRQSSLYCDSSLLPLYSLVRVFPPHPTSHWLGDCIHWTHSQSTFY